MSLKHKTLIPKEKASTFLGDLVLDIEYRVQSTDYRLQITEYRLQSTDERADSFPGPLQERGVVTIERLKVETVGVSLSTPPELRSSSLRAPASHWVVLPS